MNHKHDRLKIKIHRNCWFSIGNYQGRMKELVEHCWKRIIKHRRKASSKTAGICQNFRCTHVNKSEFSHCAFFENFGQMDFRRPSRQLARAAINIADTCTTGQFVKQDGKVADLSNVIKMCVDNTVWISQSQLQDKIRSIVHDWRTCSGARICKSHIKARLAHRNSRCIQFAQTWRQISCWRRGTYGTIMPPVRLVRLSKRAAVCRFLRSE